MMNATSDSDTTPIPAWVNVLARAGHSAPSADNSQPWRFIWNDRNLSLTFDTSRGEAGLGRSHPAVQIAFGAVIENMIQAGTSAGMDVMNWDLRYLNSEDGPFLVIPPPSTDPNVQEPPNWITSRHTSRGKYFSSHLPRELAFELTNLTEGKATVTVYNETNSIRELAKFVRRASEIRFQTEEVHRWLGSSLRFTPDEANRGDGLDIETLALPPGGKLLLKFITDWRRMNALNRCHAYKLLSFVEGMQFGQCGGVVTIVGPNDNDPARWITAGRLMERAWLLLNRKELSVHPYFVLPDLLYRLEANGVPDSLKTKASDINASARDFLKLQNQTLFMVMRVGMAKNAPQRSKRLPLNAVLSYQ